MAQDPNPPSFMPSSNRRRPSSTNQSNTPNTPAEPPAPQGSQQASRTAQSNQSNQTYQPKPASQASQQPKPANQQPSQVAAPPSFSPVASRTSRGTQSQTGNSSSGNAPASFAPAAGRQRSSASNTSSRNASAGTAPKSSSFTTGSTTPTYTPNRTRNTSGKRQTSTAYAVAAPAKKKRGARKIISAFLVVVLLLLAALGVSLFCAWGWVDGKLNRTDWLTSASDTSSATSWLLLGTDERDGSTGSGDAVDVDGSRTDTILVLTKPKKGNASLISIPRDSLVEVNGQYMKINAVSELASMQDLVSTVENITGQKIDHVAQIRFGGLQNVVNALDGVDLCYDQDVNDPYSGLNWEAGCHTADGGTALAFARMRYADAAGDFGRNERQRQVISAIIKKIMSKSVITNIPKLLKVGEAGLDSLTVDQKTHTGTMLSMALAFKDATGDNGVSGSVYWTNPDYYVDGVGSSVLLDDDRNAELFTQLANGSHEPGAVGSLAEG